MRILVVDDEIVSRKKMEKIMGAFGECLVADSGRAALKAFEAAIYKKEPIDLITLDVSMPQMDGTEVLYEIREIEKQRNILRENQVKVIMVTAQTDRDTVITCIQAGCDNYITKPFDREIIAKKLITLGINAPEPARKNHSIRKMVMEIIHNFNQDNIHLPVLPQITREIESIIEKSTSGAEELAGILEKDAVISVKLIATANSALYSKGSGKAQNLKAAIARLGITEVQSIVAAIANREYYKTRNRQFKGLLEKLWLHSLSCAHCCRAISGKLGDRDNSKVFLMGLTHDIGCVIMLQSIGDIAPENMEFDENELMESLHEVHTSFGAALLDKCGFDREYADVVRFHKWNSFDKGTRREILIVNLADKISSKIKFGFFESDADISNLESAKKLGIDEKFIEEIAEEVQKGIKEVEKVFRE